MSSDLKAEKFDSGLILMKRVVKSEMGKEIEGYLRNMSIKKPTLNTFNLVFLTVNRIKKEHMELRPQDYRNVTVELSNSCKTCPQMVRIQIGEDEEYRLVKPKTHE
jgi:hypothetical protein